MEDFVRIFYAAVDDVVFGVFGVQALAGGGPVGLYEPDTLHVYERDFEIRDAFYSDVIEDAFVVAEDYTVFCLVHGVLNPFYTVY